MTKPSRTPGGLGAAAGDHDAQYAVERLAAARVEQLGDLRLELGAENLGEAEVRPRTLEPVEVVRQREGDAVVHADHLEHPVAAQQPLVGGGDRKLGGGRDMAVDRAELGCGGRSPPFIAHGPAC
jgi:hypothetical protein